MGRKLAALIRASLFIVPMAGCTASIRAGSTPAEPAAPPAESPAPAPTPEPAPAPVVEVKPAVGVKQEGNKLTMPGNIVFETGKATLLPESEPVLEDLRKYLEANPKITLVRIEGHTDNAGQPAFNLKLSGDRALTVRNWLVAKNIDAKRLIAVGFGDTKPVADNATDEGKSKNRRTDFIVVELAGKPWLGADPVSGGTVFGENPRAKK